MVRVHVPQPTHAKSGVKGAYGTSATETPMELARLRHVRVEATQFDSDIRIREYQDKLYRQSCTILGMHSFIPVKITDPRTGEERVISTKEQMTMLERGILFDVKPIRRNSASLDKLQVYEYGEE